VLLALAQGALAQLGYEVVQPDFTHSHQARVVLVLRQFSIQTVKVIVMCLADVQRVNAQAITVTADVGQLPNRLKICGLNRWQHTNCYIICSFLRPYHMR
jgi:hypothetical protein